MIGSPGSGWEDITVHEFISPFQFSFSNILSYFITRSVLDGNSAGDLKSIDKSAENLFVCVRIQNLQVCSEYSLLLG